MHLFQLFAVGAGLSSDAFAVSVCEGLSMQKADHPRAFMTALFFGGFQALMPVIGWFCGSRFAALIGPVDHWVAFLLLFAIGGKMIYDTLKDKDDSAEERRFGYGRIFLLAVATSIDALAVGITLGVLGYAIGVAALVIGCTTFALSLAGVYAGYFFGGKFRRAATAAGGAVLILIGLQILLEHLGVM